MDNQGVQLILSVDCGTAQHIKVVPHFIANFKIGGVTLRLKGGKTVKRPKARFLCRELGFQDSSDPFSLP